MRFRCGSATRISRNRFAAAVKTSRTCPGISCPEQVRVAHELDEALSGATIVVGRDAFGACS